MKMDSINIDPSEISQLMQRWAYSRDNGRWDDLAATFSPEGEIAVTWFRGAHSDFVQASKARHGRSFNRHVMLGTVCEVRGKRAWAETGVMMIGHGALDGVPVRWTCHFRFIDLLEHDGTRLAVHRRTAVYDMDTLDSDSEAASIPFDEEDLRRFPRGYRFLGYRLVKLGLEVPADLPTAGSVREKQLRSEAEAWIASL